MRFLLSLLLIFSTLTFAKNIDANKTKAKQSKKLGLNIKPGRWFFKIDYQSMVSFTKYEKHCIKNPTKEYNIKRMMKIADDATCKIIYHKQGNFTARLKKRCVDAEGKIFYIDGRVKYKGKSMLFIYDIIDKGIVMRVKSYGKYINHCYEKEPTNIKKYFK